VDFDTQKWLKDWVKENLQMTRPADAGDLRWQAASCIRDAMEQGIDTADLIEAAGGDLVGYLALALKTSSNGEIKRNPKQK
jgi:hypothetical protein